MTQAPDFTLNHIEGHPVNLRDYRGQRVVVIFAAKDSGDQAKAAATTIREQFDHAELPLLLVIDLSRLPKMLQRIAKSILKKGYEEAVATARADYAAKGRTFPAVAADAVIMLPDPDGSVTAGFGVGDVRHVAAAVLIDEDGTVLGTGSGAEAGEQILKLLE